MTKQPAIQLLSWWVTESLSYYLSHWWLDEWWMMTEILCYCNLRSYGATENQLTLVTELLSTRVTKLQSYWATELFSKLSSLVPEVLSYEYFNNWGTKLLSYWATELLCQVIYWVNGVTEQLIYLVNGVKKKLTPSHFWLFCWDANLLSHWTDYQTSEIQCLCICFAHLVA